MKVKTNRFTLCFTRDDEDLLLDTPHCDQQLITTKHIQQLVHIIPREAGEHYRALPHTNQLHNLHYLSF